MLEKDHREDEKTLEKASKKKLGTDECDEHLK